MGIMQQSVSCIFCGTQVRYPEGNNASFYRNHLTAVHSVDHKLPGMSIIVSRTADLQLKSNKSSNTRDKSSSKTSYYKNYGKSKTGTCLDKLDARPMKLNKKIKKKIEKQINKNKRILNFDMKNRTFEVNKANIPSFDKDDDLLKEAALDLFGEPETEPMSPPKMKPTFTSDNDSNESDEDIIVVDDAEKEDKKSKKNKADIEPDEPPAKISNVKRNFEDIFMGRAIRV